MSRGLLAWRSTDEEISKFQEQLSAILEAVGKVDELDLSGVEPTAHPLDSRTCGRPTRCGLRCPRGGPRECAGQRGRVLPGAGGMIDTLRVTAKDLEALLTSGEASSDEIYAAYRAAIDERDGELNCFLHVCDESPGPGVPVAFKDVITTRGVPTTAGSRILEGFVPVYDATVAERCAARGLRTIGKTNMDEFAMGSSTENSAYGPTQNPWDPSASPVAPPEGRRPRSLRGLAPWALGSDTGGSVKQPAALCGVVGLRPTYGTVSRYGIVAFASSLDQVGPIAKTVGDCAFLYSVIAGRDPNDTTTVDLPHPVEIPKPRTCAGSASGCPGS